MDCQSNTTTDAVQRHNRLDHRLLHNSLHLTKASPKSAPTTLLSMTDDCDMTVQPEQPALTMCAIAHRLGPGMLAQGQQAISHAHCQRAAVRRQRQGQNGRGIARGMCHHQRVQLMHLPAAHKSCPQSWRVMVQCSRQRACATGDMQGFAGCSA